MDEVLPAGVERMPDIELSLEEIERILESPGFKCEVAPALQDVCQEYGVRLARETLAEANGSEAWELALGLAGAICEKGGNGAEFLRRISILLYSYASTALMVRRAWGSRSFEPHDAVAPAEAISVVDLAKMLGGEIVQLSLWNEESGGDE
jgi:hypothetical protein